MGGKSRAQEMNRRLAPLVDVLIGNEEDFSAALGFEIEGADANLTQLDIESFRRMMKRVAGEFSVPVVATTLRQAITATRNDWGAIAGGDAFVSGMVYGFLSGQSPQWCVECGAAHGALAMTTPGDTTMATLPEVLQVMQGKSARIAR